MASEEWKDTLNKVLADRRRGASEIEERLLRALIEVLGAVDEKRDLEALLESLTTGAFEHQPAMANLLALVDRSWRLWEAHGKEGDVRERLLASWRRRLECLQDREAALGRYLVAWARSHWSAPGPETPRPTLLTLSRSGTVRSGLRALATAGWDPVVLVGEGRPGNEGRALARELCHPECGAPKLDARLVTDAVVVALAAGSSPTRYRDVVSPLSAVVVGADAVGPDELLNKVGTRALAAAARERGLPVLVLADAAKLVSRRLLDRLELPTAPPEELEPPPGVPALSFYFERIPLTLVTRVITDQGALGPEDVEREACTEVSRRLG